MRLRLPEVAVTAVLAAKGLHQFECTTVHEVGLRRDAERALSAGIS
jgi:hypothetical protein